MKQKKTVNKMSLIEKYPMLRNPALWIVTAGALVVSLGWVIAAEPLESYVDAFPFNRNWSQYGSGTVTKCEGPFKFRNVPTYYIVHFTWSSYYRPHDEYMSKCVFFEPFFYPREHVSILAYKNNPSIAKIHGSYVTIVSPDQFFVAFASLVAVPIGFTVFVRSFPPPRKKKKRSLRGGSRSRCTCP